MRALTLMLFALTPCLAAPLPTPIFSADFENTLQASGPDGPIEPVNVAGEPTYQAGRIGQALLVGDDACRVTYPAEGNLDPSQGTISLWVKPLDWRPQENKYHVFFEAGAPNEGWLLFYIFYSWRQLLFRPEDEAGRATYTRAEVSDWKPGQWRHIAATWTEGVIHCFIDGELVATEHKTFLPSQVQGRFMLGDYRFSEPRQNHHTLLDQVRIFDRPLSQRAIMALARQWTLTVDRQPEQLRWAIEVSASDPDLAKAGARFEVRREDAETPAMSGGIADWEEGIARQELDVAELEPGAYEVAVTMDQTTKSVPVRRFEKEIVSLENDLVALAFDAGTGGLISLHRKAGNVSLRKLDSPSPVFELHCVDFDAHSRHFAEDDWQVIRPSFETLAECVVEDERAAKVLRCVHNFPPSIKVTFTVRLPADSELSEWNIRVENLAPRLPSTALIVHRVGFPLLSGLSVGEAEDSFLVEPRYQGTITQDPINEHRRSVLNYLGQASMSWMDYYEPSAGGVYLASCDPELPQTELVIGPDREAGHMGLGIRRWTFLWPDETWEAGPCAVGLHEGDWHWAADRYREYFRRTFKRAAIPDWLQQADGWLGCGGPNWDFKTLTKVYDLAEELGLDYLQLWSEMTGGDETYHVFLYPNVKMGTPEDLKAALDDIHHRGGHVGFYQNYVTTDPTLQQFLQKDKYRDIVANEPKPFGWKDGWLNIALMGPELKYRHLAPGRGYWDGYWAACPGAKAWQDYAVYWIIERWCKEYGADTWYLDSVPPGYGGYGQTHVCFNTSHGHARPQGVNAGMIRTLQRLREGADAIKPFGLLNEGACDFFYQWTTHALGVELAGWCRNPEVFTYTHPDMLIFSGSCNRWNRLEPYYPGEEEYTREMAFNRVHLMGLRYDVLWVYPAREETREIIEYMKKLIGLRKKIKGDLYQSDFEDEIGLGPLPERVEARIFRHREGKSLTITLLDRREEKTPFSMKVDCAQHGLSPKRAKLFTLGEDAELEVSQAGKETDIALPEYEGIPAAIILQ